MGVVVLLTPRVQGGNPYGLFIKRPTGDHLARGDVAARKPFPLGKPNGQYLRLRCNFSDKSTFKLQADELQDRFRQRGYPKKVLSGAFKEARGRDRTNLLLTPKTKPIEEGGMTQRIIGQFDDQSQEVRNVLNKYWNLLLLDPDLRELLPDKPAISFRKGRSLRDRLVRSHYVRERNPRTWLDRRPVGSFKCGRCSFCKQIKTGREFTSSVTGSAYEIRDFINCRSVGVIYQATCPCPKDYVGKTRRVLRTRIVEHLGDIWREVDTPLSRHMREIYGGQIDNLVFRGIELVRPPVRGWDWDRLILQK